MLHSYLQCLRSFVFVAAVLTFVFFLVRMHNHVHFECSFCIQLETAMRTNICGVLMNVLVRSKSSHIFEFLRTMMALEWIVVTVRDLMLFQCTFGHKTFATLFANERPIAGMNGSNMSLHVHKLAKTFVTVLTRMQQLQFVGQMHHFMALKFC